MKYGHMLNLPRLRHRIFWLLGFVVLTVGILYYRSIGTTFDAPVWCGAKEPLAAYAPIKPLILNGRSIPVQDKSLGIETLRARRLMLDDITLNYLKSGMSPDNVSQILGPPDNAQKDGTEAPSLYHFTYRALGSGDYFLDHEYYYLFVDFDAKDRLVHSRIVTAE